jgi:acetyl-CoA acetyltransferase
METKADTASSTGRAARLSDRAYERIKRDIITCALEPGQNFTEEQLAEFAVLMRNHALAHPGAQFREPITVADVMAYLQARTEDWDVSVWHPGQQRASALERRLP